MVQSGDSLHVLQRSLCTPRHPCIDVWRLSVPFRLSQLGQTSALSILLLLLYAKFAYSFCFKSYVIVGVHLIFFTPTLTVSAKCFDSVNKYYITSKHYAPSYMSITSWASTVDSHSAPLLFSAI